VLVTPRLSITQLLLPVMMLAACLPSTASTPQYVARPGAAARAPVPADRVTIFTMDTLPDGVTVSDKEGPSPAYDLEVEPDFPTPEDPHQILGYITLDYPRGGQPQPQSEANRMFAEEAGKRGANAIVLTKRSSKKTVVALWLSRAAPRTQFAPAGELLTTPPERAPANAAPAETEVRKLESFEPVKLESKRGVCYAVRIALGGEARLSTHARRSLTLHLDSNDRELAITEFGLGSGIPNTTRTFSSRVGCPQVSGHIAIDLHAAFGSAASRARVHDLGAGEVHFRVYTWQVGEQELQDQARATQKSIEQAETSRDAHAGKVCSACRRRKDECLEKRRTGCVDDFDRCVFASGINREACPY
jgi:hypothetical protein